MSCIIASVDADSPLFGRVFPGERLLSISGHDVRDVLDYKFHGYDARLRVTVADFKGAERTLRVRKSEGEELGLVFDTYLMDTPRACSNRCLFCFVDQLPRGMRGSLYFKDDDARLSFLQGSYITLTNLSERELERIIDLRVSPINVSVHATEPELRARLLGNPKGAEGYELMRRLANSGIVMNCQIVCCPGLNDGAALSRSMEELAELYPRVASVSVVPVGLTAHREGLFPLSPFDAQKAAEVIGLVEAYSLSCLEKHGSRIFFCADELYLKAGRAIPDDEYYEDYPQLENGVGLLRLFETEFSAALRLAPPSDKRRSVSVSTGVAAADCLQKIIQPAREKYANIAVEVYAVENRFFGGGVDVAGLVVGRDLIARLRGADLGEELYIPRCMLRHGEGVFLDGVTLAEAEGALGVPITPVERDGGDFFDKIFG